MMNELVLVLVGYTGTKNAESQSFNPSKMKGKGFGSSFSGLFVSYFSSAFKSEGGGWVGGW